MLSTAHQSRRNLRQRQVLTCYLFSISKNLTFRYSGRGTSCNIAVTPAYEISFWNTEAAGTDA